jgi:uncharacterized protein YjiS (DUF1127 family)
MIGYTPRNYPAAMPFQIARFVQDMPRVLRNLAKRLDIRIATRRKAADDRRLLSQMSEHELRDIGVSRSESQATGDVWSGRL